MGERNTGELHECAAGDLMQYAANVAERELLEAANDTVEQKVAEMAAQHRRGDEHFDAMKRFAEMYRAERKELQAVITRHYKLMSAAARELPA